MELLGETLILTPPSSMRDCCCPTSFLGGEIVEDALMKGVDLEAVAHKEPRPRAAPTHLSCILKAEPRQRQGFSNGQQHREEIVKSLILEGDRAVIR